MQLWLRSGPIIDSQIINHKASGVDIFFNVATPKFAAQAISVGAVLKPAGLENAKGVLTTVYIKDPADPAWKDGRGA